LDGGAADRRKVHRVRKLLDAIPLVGRKRDLRGLRAIYRAATKRAAVTAYCRFAVAWRKRHPRLVAGLERHLDSLLAIFDLPAINKGDRRRHRFST
jgi:transposase-like protein